MHYFYRTHKAHVGAGLWFYLLTRYLLSSTIICLHWIEMIRTILQLTLMPISMYGTFISDNSMEDALFPNSQGPLPGLLVTLAYTNTITIREVGIHRHERL